MSISVQRITKQFDDYVALRDVSVEVPKGSLTALLGPSGSGKSTLLRIVAGLETADQGSVFIDGEDVTGRPPQERGVGFVFQHYAAFKHKTVADNVAFGLKIRRRPKAEIAERVNTLLKLVQLEGLAKRYPAQLSGDSGSAWGSRELSQSTRRCCSSTSRSARSMRACERSCGNGCVASTTRRTPRR